MQAQDLTTDTCGNGEGGGGGDKIGTGAGGGAFCMSNCCITLELRFTLDFGCKARSWGQGQTAVRFLVMAVMWNAYA